ncbi:hypothetical protein BGX34_007869 [Mortierella sp. NVP85]|nr:hypothetical protein BGX34_007869 [Mortierella sp. NVP85]
MKHHSWRRLALLAALCSLFQRLDAQVVPGPIQSSQTISILGDELYLHGGSKPDSFLESNCTSELWRLRLGHSTAWNLSSELWEPVPLREDTTDLPPVSGVGLKSLNIPGNYSLLGNGTSPTAENVSPYMVEFGRGGCADESGANDGDDEEQTGPWIGFNIYNPVMNTWDSINLLNVTDDLDFDAKVLTLGDWHSPTVAIDYKNYVWYIILQSTVPLRQVILKKEVDSLTSFMSRIDLTENTETLFPTQLLYEGWKVISDLNEKAPFVGRGVATVVQDKIVVITGTANSFTPGDTQQAELRSCDHAFVFSTATNTWARQDLTVADKDEMPDTRERAAILAVGSKIYMHGGIKPYQTVLKDLWTLDTDTWTWTRGPDGPEPRADHTLLQYHEYLLAVSGFDVGRNVPVVSVLPILAFDTNTTTWTQVIRATLDEETTFFTNVTRAAIILGTVAVGLVLLGMALSTRLRKSWNQRNYMMVSENFELDEQQRRAGQSLPSILKKKYLSKGSGSRSSQKSRSQHTEVLFEDDDGDDEADWYEDEGESSGNQRSTMSSSQSSRSPRRVRIDDRVEQRVVEFSDEEGQGETDDENEEGQVVVKMPSGSSSRTK